MLTVRDLSVSYRNVSILNSLSFSLPASSVTAVLGPNGTGKSTLFKGIAGLVPASGQIDIGTQVALPRERRGTSIAYMPQDTGASSSLTVLEVILLGRLRSLGLKIPQALIQEASHMLARFGLEALCGRTLDAISGGQRQLVYLAQSLFRNPDILLLDEPTAALDIRHQLLVLDHITRHARENGTVVLIAMHDLSLAAKVADRVICLNKGGIVADGSPKDVLNNTLIEQVYGVTADILMGPSGVMHISPMVAV